MQVVLPFTYALIFIFLILKLKFFDFIGISKGQLILLFVLKIVFGFVVSAVYVFYYNTSDFDTYLKASKIGFDYFMGNSSNLIMPGWNSSFDDTMFNNSRIVIGINFLLQFISLNIQFVHILFFCFFSFAGLTALFRSFYAHFPNKRIALVIGIYLVPSVLFWTAGVFKETIAISCLGFLVYFTDFGLQKKYTSSKILLSIFLFILLFFTKIYIALAITPLLFANFMISKTEGKYIVLKYLSVFIAAVLMVHGFSKFGDKTNVYKMFADKQSKAISEANEEIAQKESAVVKDRERLIAIDKEIGEGNIEVVPIGFMRGRNFSNCFVVIDESQNITQTQLELIITRLCIGSKMIFVGDNSQIDLKDKRQSGFDYMSKKLSFIKGIQSIALKTNHRDPIVEEIINTLNDN
jgi:hypothetical protein